jgi:hypothetical protein
MMAKKITHEKKTEITGTIPVLPQQQPVQQPAPPPPPPKHPEADKYAHETVTKAMAANEVLIELGVQKQMAIISLAMVLAAGGLWVIDIYLGTVVIIGYLLYASWRLWRSTSKGRYLRYTYGV